MSSPNIYNRSYHLILQDGMNKTTKTFTELDIKFKINKIVAPCKYTAEISILGLSWNDMNDIATTSLYDISTAATKFRKRVTLTAGYNGDETPIFSGYIVLANISQPPDMWLNMTAANYIDGVADGINESFDENMTARQIVSAIAKRIGVPIVFKYTGKQADNKLGATVISGSMTDVMTKLNALCDWNVYYDNGFLFIDDKPFMKSYNSTPIRIDRANGLLKVKNIDFIGCSVITYLNSRSEISGYMNVESELMPVANGKYWISSITHEGHFRGNQWFTTYDGIRRESKKE